MRGQADIVQSARVAEAEAAASLHVPAQARYLSLVGMLVQWFGCAAGLSDQRRHELEVAVDEACSNVVRHAFPGSARGEMTVQFAPFDRGLRVTIVDRGTRFCPFDGTQIAGAKRLSDPASGGHGLRLIARLADETEYRWDERQGNHFTLVKYR